MKNCFAYKNNRCTALIVKKCEGCNFYKTVKEAEERRIKAIYRIKTLNIDKRNHINETYYDGELEV